MQFLLNWPTWLSFLVVSAVTTSAALMGLHFVRRKYPAEVLKEHHEVAAIIFNAFGLLYAVVVAFVVFVTWSGYADAKKNLELEASQTLDLFYSAKAFPDDVAKTMQQALMRYVHQVDNDELKRISKSEIPLYSGGALGNLITLFNTMDETAAPNRELYAESLNRLNKLAEYRRLRIFAGNKTVPPVIWTVVLIGGLITVAYTYFLGVKNVKTQYVMTSALTVTMTLILLLIYILDHPFTGSNKVSTEPLTQTIDVMQRNYQGGPLSR